MVYLSLHVGMNTLETEQLWKNHALRTVKHNRRLRNRLLATMKPVYLESPAGVITERHVGSPWDSEAHDKVIERMIRGLYFYHFSEILGDRVKYKVQWLSAILDGIYEMFCHSATLALSAGFDGVELHMGHGYLVDQFLDGRA